MQNRVGWLYPRTPSQVSISRKAIVSYTAPAIKKTVVF